VELIYFNASCYSNPDLSGKESKVVLQWASASEQNNDYFSVERSANGNTFEEVGKIKGAGNSSTIRNYEFTDNELETLNLKLETLYYRLKQVDFDGKFEFSPIRAVKFPCEKNEIEVLPNPSTGIFFINNISEGAEVNVFNVLGEKMYSEKIPARSAGGLNPKSLILNLAIPNGIYFLSVKDNDKTFCRKIIISR